MNDAQRKLPSTVGGGIVRVQLIFNMAEERLYGTMDGLTIDTHAVAGGRAGSKTPGAVNPILANNPFTTHVKLSPQIPGGALPLGTYSLKSHESRNNWIRLLPTTGMNMVGRDGFAIHGRGKRGSDGCIVPSDFKVFLTLFTALKKRERLGADAPLLSVIAVGELGRFERLLNLA